MNKNRGALVALSAVIALSAFAISLPVCADSESDKYYARQAEARKEEAKLETRQYESKA